MKVNERKRNRLFTVAKMWRQPMSLSTKEQEKEV